MSHKPDHDCVPGEEEASAQPTPEQAEAGLPRPLQEDLGRQLRTAYQALADKPAFLGDPALPPQFDRQIQRLETRERVRRRGLQAVERALEHGPGPTERAASPRRARRDDA